MKQRFARHVALSAAILLSALLALAGGAGFAADKQAPKMDPQVVEFFEARVRPVLFEKCFACHGERQQMANLRLDSLEGLLKGGSHGPVIVPGHPERSALIQAIRHDGKIRMPPAGKLKDDEIAALTEWVKRGAPWPDGLRQKRKDAKTQAGGAPLHWSFVPVKTPAIPKVKNSAWVKTPIDAFILAKLERKGLRPAPPADKRTLIRRAYYDLIGLPPTAEEVAAFYADRSPDAFAKVVDRLLASPRYGERWGRYWLDVARYADTKGYLPGTETWLYPNAYTYRDYVIRAFNEDLPYDQFILQQLAADLLPLGEDKRPLAALGFLTVGRRFLGDRILINDDRIDVTTRGFMALSVNCARCHDHKFDPISTKDYYALYGVFNSSNEPNPPLAISPKEITGPYEAHNSKIREAEKQREELVQAQVTRLRKLVETSPDSVPMPVRQVLQGIRVRALPEPKDLERLTPQFEADAQARLKSLQETIAALQKTMPPAPEFAMALQDAPNPSNARIFIRGNPGNLGEEVPRRFLAVLSRPDSRPFAQGSGRLELAQAIASKDNPLTARVLVNRVWLHHFGQGLVRTPGDFGTRGQPPTHPELLDWLAAAFTEREGLGVGERGSKDARTRYACGWSLKKLHRLIMLSNTYQMSSQHDPRHFAIDPDNLLLWRMNRRRLDLEALRDSLLYVAGRLDLTMGGKSVELTTAPYSTRRTVYGFIDRQNLQGLFRTFDFASPDSTVAQRYETTVPQQALFMMNSPFFAEQAKHLAQRALENSDGASVSDTERLHRLYRLALGRTPTSEEVSDGLRFLRQASAPVREASLNSPPPSQTASSTGAWEQYAQVLLMTNEFYFVD